jgi:hypothetical protein
MEMEKDFNEKKLTKTHQGYFRTLRNYARSVSSGVYLHPSGKEYCAWINYSPPYDKNGGSWRSYGNSPNTAVETLYKKVKDFRKTKVAKVPEITK